MLSIFDDLKLSNSAVHLPERVDTVSLQTDLATFWETYSGVLLFNNELMEIPPAATYYTWLARKYAGSKTLTRDDHHYICQLILHLMKNEGYSTSKQKDLPKEIRTQLFNGESISSSVYSRSRR